MTDQNSQEPTMEEILASIRRIISEDDPPAAGAEEAAAPEPVPAPVLVAPAPAPVPAPVALDEEEDVLELTDRLDEPDSHMESVGDLDVFPTAAPKPAPAAEPAPSMWDAEDTLVSAPAASEAASSFAALTGAILMPRDGRTLEDVVRELLRPLMKQWLDENLPRIVEGAVKAEVERISRIRP